MDPLSVIVGAVVAGASGGVSESAGAAVRSAYEALVSRIQSLFGRGERAEVVNRVESDPVATQEELRAALAAADADRDAELLAAAQRLWALLDPQAFATGAYRVDLRDAKGVQLGDHNTQINTF